MSLTLNDFEVRVRVSHPCGVSRVGSLNLYLSFGYREIPPRPRPDGNGEQERFF